MKKKTKSPAQLQRDIDEALGSDLPWTGHWQMRRRDYSKATPAQLRAKLGADHIEYILRQRHPAATARGRARGEWDANNLELMSAYDRLADLIKHRRDLDSGVMDMITFKIYDNGGFARTLTFPSDPSATVIKIGRVSSADLRFEHDDQIARMHAVLEVTSEGINLVDLGSPLGTRVNGKKVRRLRLRSGDVIEAGRQRIEIVFDMPADTTAVKTDNTVDDGSN